MVVSYGLSALFVVMAAVSLALEMYLFSDGSITESMEIRYVDRIGMFTYYIQFPMVFVLFLYFLHMMHILHTHFATSLTQEKRKIKCLFGVFLLIYFLRAIFSIGIGEYRNGLVCQVEVRWLLLNLFNFFFEFFPVTCVLYFHHQTFKKDETQDRETIRERASKTIKIASEVLVDDDIDNFTTRDSIALSMVDEEDLGEMLCPSPCLDHSNH